MMRIIKISLFTATIFGLLVLMGFILKENKYASVVDVQVNIFRHTNEGFLSRNLILNTIDNIDSISNLTVYDINTRSIEKKLSLNPYVENTDSYITLDGKLLINIEEKAPVIRIYNKQGTSIYIDGNGDFIPVSNNYTPRVLIANGYIKNDVTSLAINIYDTIYDNSLYREIFRLTQLILNNKLLSSQISQIYVNSKGEYDLIPELGDHVINFGDITKAERKLKNLEAYYRKNMVTENWDNYSTINLIYKDQIVCTKK